VGSDWSTEFILTIFHPVLRKQVHTTSIHVLPCLRYEKQQEKPKALSYPHNPVTIGEHIKKKRMELRLLQSDVARIFKVSPDCITNWENNRSIPQINYYPRIIDFLGYCPFEFDETTLSGRLKAYRWRNGLSYKRLGKILDVDGSTVCAWENGENFPPQKRLKKLDRLLKKDE